MKKAMINLKFLGSIVNLKDASEEELFYYVCTTYEKIWNDFDLTKQLELLVCVRNVEFDLSDTCFLMSPNTYVNLKASLLPFKIRGVAWTLKVGGYDHLYRSLDAIAEKKEALEQALFERRRTLSNMQVRGLPRRDDLLFLEHI